MTFDDDFVRIHLQGGIERNWACKQLGLEWPPPQLLIIAGHLYNRERYSKLTDEQREQLSGIIRGAEYRFVPEASTKERDEAVDIHVDGKHVKHIPTLAER